MRTPFALTTVATLALATALATALAAPLAAQVATPVAHAEALAASPVTMTPVATARPDSAAAPRGAFTFNPLGLPIQYFAAEYEVKTGTAVSTGFAGSYFSPPGGDGHYATGEVKIRYYPNEIPLKGFSLGAAVGITNVGYTDTQCAVTCTDTKKSDSRPTGAVLVDYNWLMGKHDQFMIGIGAGMKRIFNVSANDANIPFVYPTLRLMFGWVQ